MFNSKMAIFFKCLSGLHAGTGTDLGIVDMPIQRERHTGFPKIESSGVKGCFRQHFTQLDKLPEDHVFSQQSPNEFELPYDFVDVAFGPEDNGAEHAGAVAFTDAKILLFPVRSAKGVFAYVTCPFVLSRLKEDFELAGIPAPNVVNIAEDGSVKCSGNALIITRRNDRDNEEKIILEEYSYNAVKDDPNTRAIAEAIARWLEKPDDQYLLNNLVILPDDDFTDFVQTATEIITRIRINIDTGTVDKKRGALFTEELLPTETVLYSLAMASGILLPENKRMDEDKNEPKTTGYKKSPTLIQAETYDSHGKYLLEKIETSISEYMQIGGGETIGKGIVSVHMLKGGKSNEEN